MRVLRSLLINPVLRLDFHLQQLLPAIFTCVLATKLSQSPAEDHWSLRIIAAETAAFATTKYSSYFPDLQGKICKTYLDGLSDEKALSVVYGAMVGLSALGNVIVQSCILPNVGKLSTRLENEKRKLTGSTQFIRRKDADPKTQVAHKRNNEKLVAIEKCRQVVLHVLGRYMVSNMVTVLPSTKNREAGESMALCELEEALVPYYAIASKEVDQARSLFI
jgi:hypothetical protein